MTKLRTYLPGLITLLTDFVFMDIILLTFDVLEGGIDMELPLPLWFVCGSMTYVLNVLLVRRSVTMNMLLTVNILCFGLSISLLLIFGESILSRAETTIIVVVFAAIGVGRSAYMTLHPPTLSQQITRLDVLILAAVWNTIVRADNRWYFGLMVFFILLNMMVLVLLRVGGGESSVLLGAPAAGSVLSLGIAGGLGLLLLCTAGVFADGSANMISGVVSGLSAVAGRTWTAINAFMEWFASLFESEKMSDAGSFAAEQGEKVVYNGNDWVVDALIVKIILICIAAVVLFFLVRGFLKLRNVRVLQISTILECPEKIHQSHLPWGLKKRIKAGLAELRFRWNALRYRNSAAGLLVWVERRSAKAGKPRLKGQSIRSFLKEQEVSCDLSELIDALEKQYYGGEAGTLTRKACNEIRGAFRNRT